MRPRVAFLGVLAALVEGCSSTYIDDQVHPTLQTGEIHATRLGAHGEPGTFVDRLVVVVDYEAGAADRKIVAFSARVIDPEQPDAAAEFPLASSRVSFAPHERKHLSLPLSCELEACPVWTSFACGSVVQVTVVATYDDGTAVVSRRALSLALECG